MSRKMGGLLRETGTVRRAFGIILPLGAVIVLSAQAFAQPSASSSSSPPPVLPPAASGSSSASGQAVVDPKKEEARLLLKQGVSLYRSGDPQRALDFFLRSRQIFPAWGNTGNAAYCLKELGRFDEALELFEEGLTVFSASITDAEKQALRETMADLRAALGSVFVTSTTTGLLQIDGRARGSLPMSSPVRVLPGPHMIRVIKDGYRTFEKQVTVKVGGTETVDAKLTPLAAAGGIRIEDQARPGSEVFVDGVKLGHTPWEGTLKPGPHVVHLQLGEFGSAPTLATVIQGQTVLLRLKSARLAPSRSITVKPDTAELKIWDAPVGKGQWAGPLPAGLYVITASEEGYITSTTTIEVIETDDAPILIELKVDKKHPRWPKKESFGTFLLGGVVMYGVAPNFRGDVNQLCSPRTCASQSNVDGAVLGLDVGVEFPFGMSFEIAAGYLSLGSAAHRRVSRRAETGQSLSAKYELDDSMRLKGFWAGLGVALSTPLGRSVSLRSRFRTGFVLSRSSDSISGEVSTLGGRDSVSVEHSGVEMSSSPLFFQPELGLTAQLGDWRLGAGLGVWFFLSSGPALPNGALRVNPNCPSSISKAPGCVVDSNQLDGETAFRPFAMLTPQLSLSHPF